MTQPQRPWIGGSILPSSNPQILQPIRCSLGVLQVHPREKEDTHELTLTPVHGMPLSIAKHPNGYSCHELATRMVLEGGVERALQQATYIERCGGWALPPDKLRDLIVPQEGG